MRRIVLRGPAALLLLTACAPSALPPQEVMRRATAASQTLESASFQAEGYVQGWDAERRRWDFTLSHGVLKDGGKQVQFTLMLKQEDVAREETVVDMAMLYPCDLYLKPIRVASGASLLGISHGQLDSMKGEWWRMSCKGSTAVMPTTPDPASVTRQSDVLMVKKEWEREEIHGRDAYHYGIGLDADKLTAYIASFSSGLGGGEEQVLSLLGEEKIGGELWVDAESFYLHRLVWNLQDVRKGGASVPVGMFDLQLQDHDGVLSSTLPARARLLTGVTLTDTDLPSLIPALLPVR
ncbi:MAG: hypothetical protein WC698_02415 [Candidatus Peribacteraceae bacterium]|jgi:hypothetical protein